MESNQFQTLFSLKMVKPSISWIRGKRWRFRKIESFIIIVSSLFSSMIKNIVLDMGNVCCKWNVDYISSKLTTNKEDQEFLIKYLFQSPQWLQLDKGSISLKEAKQQLLESVSKEKRELIE